MVSKWIEVAVVAVVIVGITSASCPHQRGDLVKWSDASTWGGDKPAEEAEVTLTEGMHVLLDETPPPLSFIHVHTGASLVWDHVDGITLTTSYILVNGEFHMGSDDCRFEKMARIILTGLSNSSLEVAGFGRKFFGVAENGTIELHGRDKLSWTKLGAPIEAGADQCGVVYDHKNTDFNNEWGKGIHMAIWNLDGTLFDFGVFFTGESWDRDSEKRMVEFMSVIPDNKVVALGVHRRLGTDEKPDRDWESVFTAVESLGGMAVGSSLIRDVNDEAAYAFITLKGSPDTTMEQHVPIGAGKENAITDDVHLTLWDKKLKFSIESAVVINSRWQFPHDIDFRVVSTEIAYPKVTVIDDASSWQPGDKIVVTSTDFDWRQAEEFEIFPCTDCDLNQIRVDGEFRYPHYGRIYDGVDMRAEVALLSRDIVIEGQMEETCYVTGRDPEKEEWLCSLFKFDHFGGHFKIVKGFESAHIQGVEFYHMGQQEFSGSYPIHFHMCDSVEGSWVRGNSVHRSLARCVTIHGTDYLEVSDNVCYDHLGHGYFLEDSVEQHNVLDGNIGIGTKHGTHILTDMQNRWCNKTLAWNCNSLSTFWITHFNNYIRNNVAAGSDNTGFWFNYADKPLGPSRARQEEKLANGEPAVTEYQTRHTPILEFDNNVAHSNHERGLNFDSRISHGLFEGSKWLPQNARFSSNKYDPREPNTPDGEQVTTYIKRLTVYKNKVENIWLRAGNVVLANCSIADSQRGLTMAKSKGDTFTEVRDSIFIGMSDNKGVPVKYTHHRYSGSPKPTHQFDRSLMSHVPTDPLQGFIFYDGPNYVTNCYFNDYSHWHFNQTWDDEFDTPGYRTGGAISWRRGSMLVFDPMSSATGVKFGFCDPDYTTLCEEKISTGNMAFDGNTTMPGFEKDNDGKLQATAHDIDGSLTGTPNTQVVKNIPFFTSPRCSARDSWGMAVCPYKYSKVHVSGDVWRVASSAKPVFFVRDDAHEYPYSMQAGQAKSYHMMLNKTYTVHFTEKVPINFRLTASNMESGDFMRVGVCMPKDMTRMELSSWYPSYMTNHRYRPAIEVDTIEALDADRSGHAFFWDRDVGMVFLKLMSNETRSANDKRSCPNGKCPNFNIKRLDGSATADCLTAAYGPYAKTPESVDTSLSEPICEISTSEGLGAGAVREATVNTATTAEEEEDTCPAPDQPAPEPLAEQFRGCMVDNWRRDMTGSNVQLHASMTRAYCVKRCAQLGYRYAGLQYMFECFCDNTFGGHGGGEGCDKPCKGNPDETCGGSWRNEVFATGIAGPTPLTRCGPGNRGVEISGRCYLIGEEKRTFMDAQKQCLLMGGNLATIDSEEIQSTLSAYLGQGKSHVWTGLTDAVTEGEFVFMDGTPASYLGGDIKGDDAKYYDDFIAMDYNLKYAWDDRRWSDQNRYICQLPIQATSPPTESCGPNGDGHKLGSDGQCYKVVNTPVPFDTAQHECIMAQGQLATLDDAAAMRKVRDQLLVFGIRMDYWTGEAEVEGNRFEVKHDSLFVKTPKQTSDKNGYICRLGATQGLNACPEPWQSFGDSCYLYTGEMVERYEEAAAMCNRGSSSVVTVHSQEEEYFVYYLVKNFHDGANTDVLIGYRYRSALDMFEWTDGSSMAYTNWQEGHGTSGLSNGQCTKINYDNAATIWKNAQCVDGSYAAVCKFTPLAPAV